MNEMNPRAIMGANNPPDPIDEICAAYEGPREEAENWLDGTEVKTEDQMKAVDDLRKGMREFRISLENGSKSATAPLYDAYKAEGARWKPTIDDAKRIEDGLVGLVDTFKRKLAEEKKAAERKAWQEAEAARIEAERLAAAADVSNIEETRAAAAAAQEAEIARAQAAKASKDQVKGMRTVTRYEIEDYRAALNDIAQNDRDAVTAFIEDYVRRNYKARAINGVRVWTEKEAF